MRKWAYLLIVFFFLVFNALFSTSPTTQARRLHPRGWPLPPPPRPPPPASLARLQRDSFTSVSRSLVTVQSAPVPGVICRPARN